MWRRQPGRGLRCEARWDETGRGGGSTGALGAAGAGSQPCPFPPRAARALRVQQAQHSTASFILSLHFVFLLCPFHPVPLPSLVQTRPRHCRAQAVALPHPAEIRDIPEGIQHLQGTMANPFTTVGVSKQQNP